MFRRRQPPFNGPVVQWERSEFCANAGCVEVRRLPDGTVQVRDSKIQSRSKRKNPILTYDTQEWQAFVAGVKTGQFDV